MFDAQKEIILNVAKTVADRVCDSFDEINMLRHVNETICFAGLKEYRIAESESDSVRKVSATFELTLVGKRNLSAEKLCLLADTCLVPKLYEKPTVKEISRKACSYSKEHQRYMLSLLVSFADECECGFSPAFSVSFGNDDWSIFDECEISNSCKMFELASLSGSSLHGVVADKPLSVCLKAHGSTSGIIERYDAASHLKQCYTSLTVDGVNLGTLFVNSVSCDICADKATLCVQLSEVNA